MAFLGLTKTEREALGLDVVSERARLLLTRLLRARVSNTRDGRIALIHQNHAINIARTILGLPIYRLDGGDWGEYEPAEYAWHNAEMEVVMRRPNTAQLAETLADLIAEGILEVDTVSQVLQEDGVSFTIDADEDLEHRQMDVSVRVESDKTIAAADLSEEHPSIRALCNRMDVCIEKRDAPGALHSSASIFEALAKDVVAKPSVQDQTLGGFFESYRKASHLPAAVLDYIKAVYDRRNTEPTAGHGSLAPPTITLEEAILMAEMTKALVRSERRLKLVEASAHDLRGSERAGGSDGRKQASHKRRAASAATTEPKRKP